MIVISSDSVKSGECYRAPQTLRLLLGSIRAVACLPLTQQYTLRSSRFKESREMLLRVSVTVKTEHSRMCVPMCVCECCASMRRWKKEGQSGHKWQWERERERERRRGRGRGREREWFTLQISLTQLELTVSLDQRNTGNPISILFLPITHEVSWKTIPREAAIYFSDCLSLSRDAVEILYFSPSFFSLYCVITVIGCRRYKRIHLRLKPKSDNRIVRKKGKKCENSSEKCFQIHDMAEICRFSTVLHPVSKGNVAWTSGQC